MEGRPGSLRNTVKNLKIKMGSVCKPFGEFAKIFVFTFLWLGAVQCPSWKLSGTCSVYDFFHIGQGQMTTLFNVRLLRLILFFCLKNSVLRSRRRLEPSFLVWIRSWSFRVGSVSYFKREKTVVGTYLLAIFSKFCTSSAEAVFTCVAWMRLGWPEWAGGGRGRGVGAIPCDLNLRICNNREKWH